MINEALELDLEVELDRQFVYNLKITNKTEGLFKYLINIHCNDLNRYLPFMFETIEDYTEILFPEGLLGTDSFIRQMIDPEYIEESNWERLRLSDGFISIIFQKKMIELLQEKRNYKTEEIPFATQLFTPEWIVRYMVQNTLGRYWIESHSEHRDLFITGSSI